MPAASNAGSELGFPSSSAASRRNGGGGRGGGGAGGGGGPGPSSSAAGAMADDRDRARNDDDMDDDDDDDDGLVTVLWGTTVTIGASMKSFEWFLKDFTCGDRQSYDPWRLAQAQYKRDELETKMAEAHLHGELDTVAHLRAQLAKVPQDADIEFSYTKEHPDKKLYQHHLARMRDTGQTNLNLDVVDLLAFRWRETQRDVGEGAGAARLSREDREYAQLYKNFLLYPQELVPILDQQLKDSALEWACAEDNLGDGPMRSENEQRAREMHGAVFKVRPYAGENKVNMRELNPQGASSSRSSSSRALLVPSRRPSRLTLALSQRRHRQDRLHPRPRHPRDAHHPRHEARCVVLLLLSSSLALSLPH